jgi:large subunit ribosomal protein L19
MTEEKKVETKEEVVETPEETKEEVKAETTETPEETKEEVKAETEETKEETVEEPFLSDQLKTDIPEIKAGDVVRVHQRIKDKNKERIQVFEGQVLFFKHGKGISGTMTVRKVSSGIGIEKTFPIHSPLVEKIELVKPLKARRAKLYYLREAKGRKARLKARDQK